MTKDYTNNHAVPEIVSDSATANKSEEFMKKHIDKIFFATAGALFILAIVIYKGILPMDADQKDLVAAVFCLAAVIEIPMGIFIKYVINNKEKFSGKK